MAKINLPLTKREEDVFAFILGYIVDNEFSPTRQEIADEFMISVQGAQKFVQNLINKGKVRTIKQRGKQRTHRNLMIVKQDN